MKTIKTLTVIGLAIATIYVIILLFSMAQIAHERANCKLTPLDQLSSADYQYCIREGLLR